MNFERASHIQPILGLCFYACVVYRRRRRRWGFFGIFWFGRRLVILAITIPLALFQSFIRL
tara:strand:+ start:4079 stop:4261 length:183 start_codon:yes stop_codon:yes gene_type:complete